MGKRVFVCSDFSALRHMKGRLIYIGQDRTCLVILDGMSGALKFDSREIQVITA
jgi:hypothetical protein